MLMNKENHMPEIARNQIPGLKTKLSLCGRLSISFVFLLCIYATVFFINGYASLGYIILPLICTFLIFPVLSKLGFNKISRQGFVILANITVMIFSIMAGKGSGIDLLFIFMIILPFILFDIQEKYHQIFSIIILLSCMACTQLFHFFNPGYGITDSVASLIQTLTFYYVFIAIVALNAMEYFLTTSRSVKLKASNHELGNYKDKLEEMVVDRTKALEEANKSKSEFLASMSNEIISPINEIIGYNKLLGNQFSNEDQTYIEEIDKSSQELLILINDIIDISKLETGWIKLNKNPLDLKLILHEIRETYIDRCAHKNVSFNLNIPKSFPHRIILDEIRLRQILINIISNSVKFTPSGSISIDVNFDYLAEDKISLDLKIADTGKGMSDSKLKHLFDAFRVSNVKDSVKYKGTGLGLSICDKLTQMMGGSIKAKSQLNRGTSFSLNFSEIEISQQHAISTEGLKEVEEIEFNQQTVLAVDDVPFNRDVVKKVLTKHNLKVVVAENGAEAILIAQRTHPDLIIMDIRMPIMDGYQASEVLKTSSDTKDIPIIALTASTGSEVLDEEHENFFDGVLPKPIKAKLILGELSKYLDYK